MSLSFMSSCAPSIYLLGAVYDCYKISVDFCLPLYVCNVVPKRPYLLTAPCPFQARATGRPLFDWASIRWVTRRSTRSPMRRRSGRVSRNPKTTRWSPSDSAFAVNPYCPAPPPDKPLCFLQLHITVYMMHPSLIPFSPPPPLSVSVIFLRLYQSRKCNSLLLASCLIPLNVSDVRLNFKMVKISFKASVVVVLLAVNEPVC